MVYLTVGENSEFHSVLPLLHQLTIRLSASLNPFHLTHLCTLCHQGDLEHLLGPLESVTCALFAKKTGGAPFGLSNRSGGPDGSLPCTPSPAEQSGTFRARIFCSDLALKTRNLEPVFQLVLPHPSPQDASFI